MKTIIDKAGILRLINVLAVIIKHEQAKIKKVENILNKHFKNNNLSQTGKYFFQIYGFIIICKGKKINKGEIQYKQQVIEYIFELQKVSLAKNIIMYKNKNIL